MCGIAGIYNKSALPDQSPELLRRMLARIHFRGPDESGIYYNNHVALGNVRLSIIDLNTGQQPLSTPDGRFWIVFNGEIFNYIELRRSLVDLGHEFRTQSDTEVLLHAYLRFGTDCLGKLNGQFAFAIWDNEKCELFMARDRVGIRPFFYTRINDTFLFGSEIKTLVEHPEVKPSFDPVSLSQVFTLWTTITPRSLFQNIEEIPPGHFMLIQNGKSIIHRYWSLTFPANEESLFKGTFQEAADELSNLLTDAVKIRLRADVQVASYLSGGIDSSATTAIIKQVSPDVLQTFSIRFEDDEFDETPYQREVSDYLNTRHQAFMCKREDIGKLFPQVIWHTETPVLRTAPVPMYCLSRHVRESGIKVVITGEGADEMLAGYDIFKEAIIREFWSRQPDSKYRPLLLNRLYPYLAQFQGKNKSLLKFFYAYELTNTRSPFYSHLLRWHNTAGLHNYLSDSFRDILQNKDHMSTLSDWLPENFDRYDLLSKSQWLEIWLFLSGYLLSTQGDRMAMANSVEGRYPFLDYRVIEFCNKLPPGYKMHGLNEKYILKKMMTDSLPKSVLKRPKQAYRAPVSTSLLFGSARDYIMELLSPQNLQHNEIFSPVAVGKLLSKIHASTTTSEMDNMALSGIVSTELLYHQYILKDRFRPALTPLANCSTISA